jgi:DNA end-binding protein Ku
MAQAARRKSHGKKKEADIHAGSGLRPYWRGHLRLALVSCPIRLIPALTDKDTVRFHKLNRETGNRLKQQMVDSETGDVVERDETVMGYEIERGQYITVESDEIDALKIESSDVITIERVVEDDAIDWLYWDTPYLAEPDAKSGRDIFATIRDALAEKQVVGLGRAVIGRRERPILVQPRDKGLILTTLRDPDEVRAPEKIFDDIPDVKVDAKNLSMAEMLIERMKAPFDLEMFEDRYQSALRELVEAKAKGKRLPAPKISKEPSNVVNLFDALKASLGESGGKRAAKAKPAARATRSAQRKRA